MADTTSRTTDSREPVKVVLPATEGSPVGTESVWAQPVGNNRYRLQNVCAFSAASYGDTVECTPAPDGRPRAQHVTERADRIGFCLIPLDPTWGISIPDVAQQLLATSWADDVQIETMQMTHLGGILAVSAPTGDIDDVLDWFGHTGSKSLGLTDTDIRTRAKQQFGQLPDNYDTTTTGPYLIDILTLPDDPLPYPLQWTDKLLDSLEPDQPDELTIDPEDDPLLATWPAGIRDLLIDVAEEHAGITRMINQRLFRPALHLILRLTHPDANRRNLGPVGWPLAAPDTEAQADQWRAQWRDAQDPDGTVRYALDDPLHDTLTHLIRQCHIDPDADPYTPIDTPEL